MTDLSFRDLIYGRVDVPPFLAPFIRLPEFVRLRGVRLSNVDSYEFKDFSAARWEHGIAVASLAWRCGARRGLGLQDHVQLTLAGLLHDVATPPFAHTAEHVVPEFDHELETQRLLGAEASGESTPDLPVFASELPRFRSECVSLARALNTKIDPDEVARLVVGDGALGWLIAGTLDLDNADNVIRAAIHTGQDVDRTLPLRLADWLAVQRDPPTDLVEVNDADVQSWLRCRQLLYESFSMSSIEEIGRQALLQHVMRRALQSGFPRRQLIWNTDDGLLNALEQWRGLDDRSPSVRELVTRYRLLEAPTLLFARSLETEPIFRAMSLPQATAWLENELSTPYLDPCVFVSRTRGGADAAGLVPAHGTLYVFKLGELPGRNELPEWIASELAPQLSGKRLAKAFGDLVSQRLVSWTDRRPWVGLTVGADAGAEHVLDSIGDWTFRMSRNDSFHPYPGTFVHAIPASLLHALSLTGELVVDPFGGTGQTALEAIKYGGSAVSADINSVATLVARARLTYYSSATRASLEELTPGALASYAQSPLPDYPLRDQWHHHDTLDELRHIKGYCDGFAGRTEEALLLSCFSAILPETTGRWGKQHGFFADNTPLAAGQSDPPYRPALELFLTRLRRALQSAERVYAFIERQDRDPALELGRAQALRVDVATATAMDYGIEPETAAAIITSPPYLCMADYSLGNRLTYYWLFPDALDQDFGAEIGARRKRFSPDRALSAYRKDLEGFVEVAWQLVRPGGFVATILGNPSARPFAGFDLVDEAAQAMNSAGFHQLWTRPRSIQWHRNHGYARLKEETISIFQKPGNA